MPLPMAAQAIILKFRPQVTNRQLLNRVMEENSTDYLRGRNLDRTDHDLLIRQSTMLEMLVKDVSGLRIDAAKQHDDLDDRVRVLEQAYFKLMGVGSVAGLAGGWLAHLLFK